MSQLVQCSNLKNNKAIKELISEFTANYMFDAEDCIYKLFIDRKHLRYNKFGMVIKNLPDRGRFDEPYQWREDENLENEIKNVCFYNHVVGSYLTLIAHMLISFDKNNEIKNQALKRIIQMFQKQIFEILRICSTNRLTNTKEVFEEFHYELKQLENLSNIDYRVDDMSDISNIPNNASGKSDLIISSYELQQQSITNVLKIATKGSYPYQNSLWKNLLSNFYGYGRSYCLDRNEFYYTMKICHYDSLFINKFIRVIGRYNLEMSLIDSERLLIHNVHDVFAFISSLGHDGFSGSSYEKIPSSIKRATNEPSYGFSFFTIVCGANTKLTRDTFSTYRSKLLQSVGNFSSIIWNSVKRDLSDFDEYNLDFNNIVSK